ncbi:hypothetical protein M951_chr3188 (nucleomorph) [Lotharella oceanica]|uniref:Uncharacterized protein n=1 Tax=Lotharella oceanica TaxID=641309 RepID=A0A060DGH7_9EUKA|nr:hypothetical protein M951_chr117 [Lotharella oceanica]AIB09693.1 hypothetical protein M951_chr1214 [Lotharella oceanica]AIB09720.1 hypothetical protein M951_chr217 [Lotharella oceanica]AIB09896.1 hypothetical protein M951_chr2204 [Lotharella oceanica]AIB09923.1 hypothetical protein M951_chr317 [Lotharella oceanica]
MTLDLMTLHNRRSRDNTHRTHTQWQKKRKEHHSRSMTAYGYPVNESHVSHYQELSYDRENHRNVLTDDISDFKVDQHGGWFWREVQMWPVPLSRDYYRNQHRLNVLTHLTLYKYYLAGRIKDVSKRYYKTGVKSNMYHMPLKLRRFLMHHVRRLEELYKWYVGNNVCRASIDDSDANFPFEKQKKEIGCVLNGDFSTLLSDNECSDKHKSKKVTLMRPEARKYFMTFFHRYYAKTKENMYTSRFDLCKEFVLQNNHLICLPRLIKNLSSYEDMAMAVAMTTRNIAESVDEHFGSVVTNSRKGETYNGPGIVTNSKTGVVKKIKAMQSRQIEGSPWIDSLRVVENKDLSRREIDGIQVIAMDNERIDVCSPNGWVDFVSCAQMLDTIVNKFNIMSVKTEWQMALKRCFIEFAKEVDDYFGTYELQTNYQVRRFEYGMRTTIEALTYDECDEGASTDENGARQDAYYKHEFSKHITTRVVGSELVDTFGAGWEVIMFG